MDSSNLVGAQALDDNLKSNKDDTNLSDPAKLLVDFFAKKDIYDEKKTSPRFLDALIKTFRDSGINIEEYQQILDNILVFDSKINELNDNKFKEISEQFLILREKVILTMSKKNLESNDELEKLFKEISEKYKKNENEIQKLKFKELPELVLDIKRYQEKGALCEHFFSKSMLMAAQCLHLIMERKVAVMQIETLKEALADLIMNFDNEEDIPKNVFKSGRTELVNKGDTTALENFNLEISFEKSKMRICGKEHNTPFCRSCGWRTSWLMSFEERGVHIEEAVSYTSKHIWYNNVNTV